MGDKKKMYGNTIPEDPTKCPMCGQEKSPYARMCMSCRNKIHSSGTTHKRIIRIKELLYETKRRYPHWGKGDEAFYQEILAWLNGLSKKVGSYGSPPTL